MFLYILGSISFLLYGTFIITQDTYTILINPFISYINEFLYLNFSLTNLSYNIVYFVSLCQIKINKLIKQLDYYINYNNHDNTIIEFFKNGELYNYFNLNDYSNINDIINKVDNKYDYVIASLIKSTNTTHKYICNKLTNNLDFQESNIKFISINVKYNEQNFKIELKDKHYNYYIVDNEIDKQFIQYYLEYILKTSINRDNFNYNIQLVDNNVNFINLKETDSIIIYKDHYIIKQNETN